MRTRVLAILTVAVLAFAACQAASRSEWLRGPTGQRGTRGRVRTRQAAPSPRRRRRHRTRSRCTGSVT